MNKEKSSLTMRGLIIGILGLIIITSSSVYVALRMGALPWPTVFVTVLSMVALKKAKGSTLNEINVTHTIMSSGAMVAGGLAFTLPGLWIAKPDAVMPLFSIMVIAVVGALLGTIFTRIFHTVLIDEEQLPYPMGQASYNTLMSGEKGGKSAKVLFSSLSFSAIFTVLRDGFRVIPEVLTPYKGGPTTPALSIWVSPMAMGIGALIGPVLSLLWLGSSLFAYFVLTPLGIKMGLFTDMAAADSFRSSLGLGIMIGTGLAIFVKAILKLIFKKNRNNNQSKLIKMLKKEWKIILTTIAVSLAFILLFTEIKLLEAIILILGVFLTTYLSATLTGQTGINPMEVFAIIVLLLISIIFSSNIITLFSVAAIVAVACGLTGDVMNDLKSGSLLKTDPKVQIFAEGIGAIIGAIIASIALIIMKESFGGFGTAALPAPQASMVASMAQGLQNNSAFFIGIAIGLVLLLLNIPSATIGLGVYLPLYISAIMGIGSLISLLTKAFTKDKKKGDETTALVSSGLLGGEGITGVVIAIIKVVTGS